MSLAGGDVPWRKVAHGIAVRVRVTPKASRDAIEGVEPTADGPALKARVRAVPEDGAANRAVEVLVAAWLGVAKSSVDVTAGTRSRVKTVMVTGDSRGLADLAAARLAVPIETKDRRRA